MELQMATKATEPAAGAKINIPVQGMTCAACQARVQRTLAAASPASLDASVNLMMQQRDGDLRPGRGVARGARRGHPRHRLRAELPRPEQTAFEEQEARDRAQRRGVPRAAPEGDRQRRRRRRRDDRLDAAHGVSAHGARPRADPFMRWAMDVADPAAARAMPWLYAIDPRSSAGACSRSRSA